VPRRWRIGVFRCIQSRNEKEVNRKQNDSDIETDSRKSKSFFKSYDESRVGNRSIERSQATKKGSISNSKVFAEDS
jgi:hypothetical protein